MRYYFRWKPFSRYREMRVVEAYEKTNMSTRDPLRLFQTVKDCILRIPIGYSI